MKVVFACAGTGGHINPAIAIANIIKSREKNSKFLFIGTKDGLENKLVKNAGYEIKHIRTGKLIRSLTLKNFTAIKNTYSGIGDAKKILASFKPDLVIGTGGYICGPVMLAAKKLNIPYMLHESNAFPGVTVKLLAKNATCVMVGFEDAKERLNSKSNVVFTGTPAKFNRKDIDKLNIDECKKDLNLENVKKHIVLVTCGSQGAKRVNEVLLEMIEKYLSENKKDKLLNEKVFFILVTGDKNYDDISKKLQEIKEKLNIDLSKYIKTEKFVFDMDKMYKVSDLCVTRAGAMTITELLISSKPAILIPLPTAAENHQYYNAKVLEDIGAGKIIEQKNLNAESLYESINEMIDNLKDINIQKSRIDMIEKSEKNIYECIINVLKKANK